MDVGLEKGKNDCKAVKLQKKHKLLLWQDVLNVIAKCIFYISSIITIITKNIYQIRNIKI